MLTEFRPHVVCQDEEDGGEDTQFPVLWTAPEIVLRSRKKRNGKSEKKKFSHKSDVWSFGMDTASDCVLCFDLISYNSI